MVETAGFIAENERQRRRLAELTQRLDGESLVRALPNGWTVADALLHLAFWDWRMREALLEWEKTGEYHTLPDDSFASINAALVAVGRLIPRESVAAAVLQAAEAADATIAALTPDAAARAAETSIYLVKRSLHRAHHLDQIEKTLK